MEAVADGLADAEGLDSVRMKILPSIVAVGVPAVVAVPEDPEVVLLVSILTPVSSIAR